MPLYHIYILYHTITCIHIYSHVIYFRTHSAQHPLTIEHEPKASRECIVPMDEKHSPRSTKSNLNASTGVVSRDLGKQVRQTGIYQIRIPVSEIPGASSERRAVGTSPLRLLLLGLPQLQRLRLVTNVSTPPRAGSSRSERAT